MQSTAVFPTPVPPLLQLLAGQPLPDFHLQALRLIQDSPAAGGVIQMPICERAQNWLQSFHEILLGEAYISESLQQQESSLELGFEL